jgi:hypothetical protein
VPVQRLREMIYAYPTFHRGIEAALDDLCRDGQTPGCGPCDQARPLPPAGAGQPLA